MIVQVFQSIWPWVEAHPVFASMVVWPLITALVTLLFKPRSPEEYAALAVNHPRVAQFLRLVGALGIDLPKVLQVLGDLSKRVPKAPLVLLVAVSLVGLDGCALFAPANLPKTELVAKDIACILEHAFVDDSTLNTVCQLFTPAQQAAAKEFAAIHRATVATRMSAMRVESCADGGAK